LKPQKRFDRNCKKRKNNITRAEKMALDTVRGNADLTVLPADKGIATVVLNTSDYTEIPAY
jgi:hypothetical protein